MARPRAERWIQTGMAACAFVPAGVPARELAHVTIGKDEMEALRLADLECLYQEEAAGRMGVSRQTFGRIVESARHRWPTPSSIANACAFPGTDRASNTTRGAPRPRRRGEGEDVMSVLNERDAKVVAEKLGALAGPVTVAVFTRESDCDYCQPTKDLVEEVAVSPMVP